MQNEDDDYNVCLEACKADPACATPKCSRDFHKVIANTSEWVRRYFYAMGVKSLAEDLHMLTGEDAKNFIKEMEANSKREPTEKEKELANLSFRTRQKIKYNKCKYNTEPGPLGPTSRY